MEEFIYEDEIIESDVIPSFVVVCPITSNEIDDMDYERFDKLTDVFSRCGWGAKQKLLVQFEYGDFGELFENPEVCAYVRGMFERCRHLYYYLVPNKLLNGAYFLCQAGADTVRVGDEGMTSGNPLLSSVLNKTAEANYDAIKDYGFDINDPIGAMLILNNMGFLTRE